MSRRCARAWSRGGLLGLGLATGGILLAGRASAAASDPNIGGSPIPVGAGPRALGMGGAFSAVADDATAATWNPAGMSQLERPELGLSAGWYHRRVAQDGGGSDRSDELDLDHAGAVLPFHAFGCQQTVGVAWQRQFDFSRDLALAGHTDDGTGVVVDQEVRIDQQGAFATWGLSYALELRPGLALGATLQVWNDDLTGRSHARREVHEVTTVSFDPTIDPDVSSNDSVRTSQVDRGYSAVLGLWWQALPALTVAVVVKPSYTLHLANERTGSLTNSNGTFPLSVQHGTSEFTYPTSATLGLAWRQGDRDTVALDGTWTQWSHYRVVEDGVTTSPVNSYVPPGDFSDGVSVRLGYEHLVLLDELVTALRIGALYEGLPGVTRAPAPDQSEVVSAKVDRYYGVTAGVSLVFDHLLYDLGAQVRYGNDVGTGQDTGADQAADITTLIVRLGVAYQF